MKDRRPYTTPETVHGLHFCLAELMDVLDAGMVVHIKKETKERFTNARSLSRAVLAKYDEEHRVTDPVIPLRQTR